MKVHILTLIFLCMIFGIANGLDEKFIAKQKAILDLYNHVILQNSVEEQVNIAKNFTIEGSEKCVEDFNKIRANGLLPKYRLFGLTFERARNEAIALYNLLLCADHFNTFYAIACWAREYMNEGVFMYSLTLALIHRVDCSEYFIPALYEVYPFLFVTDDVLNKCSRIKEQGFVTDRKLAAMYGLYSSGDNYTITSSFANAYEYSDEEQKLSYFTNDLGLNSLYFAIHAYFPFWMDDNDNTAADNRGEFFYYTHQQIQARYNLERLSNDMEKVENFYWTKPVKVPFNSFLRYHNGKSVPQRNAIYDVLTDDNAYLVQRVEDFERRIRDAVENGYIRTKSGEQMELNMELLGRLVRGEYEKRDEYYGNVLLLSKHLLGAGVKTFDEKDYVPSALENYQTALRDPMFYRLNKRYLHYFQRFKSFLPKYTKEELSLEGVKIENVVTDRIETFMEDFDFDITNAVYISKQEMTEGKENILFFARQKRLNHKPFSIRINVTSEVTEKVLFRVFLGPKFDRQGRILKLEKSRHDFLALDYFYYELKVGTNNINRKNTNFFQVYRDAITAREVNEKIKAGSLNDDDINDLYFQQLKIPLSCLIPKGKSDGMTFKLFVIVYRYDSNKRLYYTGFPFDRSIDTVEFNTPNMLFTDVNIYHV